MIRRFSMTVSALGLVMAMLVPNTIAQAANSPMFNPPKRYYLALGDSLTFGYQQAKVNAELPNVDPRTFNSGYVDDFARILGAIRPDIQTVNYGCPGETTAEFLSAPGCPTYPFPLHASYTSSQLDAALAFLRAHPGQVSPITLTIGNNDILNLVNTCGGLQNLSCIIPVLPGVLQAIATNMNQMLGALRAAAPDSEIIVMQLYNPFAVIDPSTNAVAVALNKSIAAVAAANGARVADTFTPFNLASPQPVTLCTLTLFCTPLHDIHASDAGYLVIAKQFWTASDYSRLGGGFMVSFSSSKAGQGEVYFGSGPGCLGLVEVATQDLHPGSTTHTLFVNGNDLPGTVGDNGVIPGVTYWYEVLTVTSSGVEIDDNGGHCYRVTMPGN